MKAKPDLKNLEKDPTEFLEGGATEATESPRQQKKKGKPKGPEKYTFPCRLSEPVGELLKKYCGGNQSVFVENLLIKHFEEQGLM